MNRVDVQSAQSDGLNNRTQREHKYICRGSKQGAAKALTRTSYAKGRNTLAGQCSKHYPSLPTKDVVLDHPQFVSIPLLSNWLAERVTLWPLESNRNKAVDVGRVLF